MKMYKENLTKVTIYSNHGEITSFVSKKYTLSISIDIGHLAIHYNGKEVGSFNLKVFGYTLRYK